MAEHQNGHNFVVVEDDALFISNSQNLPVLRDNLSLTLTIPGAVLSHTIAKSSRIQGRAKRAPYIFFRIQPTATAASAASRHTAQAVERKKHSSRRRSTAKTLLLLNSLSTNKIRSRETSPSSRDLWHSDLGLRFGCLSYRCFKALLSVISEHLGTLSHKVPYLITT